jgi:hypothetical protein
MQQKHKTLIFHTFRGGRFEDHGVVLDVLPDLLQYRNILVEVAKELWRRNNPKRERLPPNFEESLTLKFYAVEGNCATIPLDRIVPAPDVDALIEQGDEFDDAAALVTRSIQAVGKGQSIPEGFPKHLLGLFEKYGTTLREDEWIEHRQSREVDPTRYDDDVRRRFVEAMNTPYEAPIDVVGTVTMARVSKPRMLVQLDDDREIEAAFDPADEEKILTALKEHKSTKVRIIGNGQHAPEGKLLKITQVEAVTVLPGGAASFDSSAKPIWEEFEEILAGIDPDELSKLPPDAAANLDHYLYGNAGG